MYVLVQCVFATSSWARFTNINFVSNVKQ